MPQFTAQLMYLGEQGMEFKNDQGQEIKMLKVRFVEPGGITIYDFSIMDETFATKLVSVIKPMTMVDCLFEMAARKDMKPFVRLLDVLTEEQVKTYQQEQLNVLKQK